MQYNVDLSKHPNVLVRELFNYFNQTDFSETELVVGENLPVITSIGDQFNTELRVRRVGVVEGLDVPYATIYFNRIDLATLFSEVMVKIREVDVKEDGSIDPDLIMQEITRKYNLYTDQSYYVVVTIDGSLQFAAKSNNTAFKGSVPIVVELSLDSRIAYRELNGFEVPPSILPGQIEFTTVGTLKWTVPDGCHLISAVVVAGGQVASSSNNGNGGYGGNLRWRNDIPVTPGEVLTIVSGAASSDNAKRNSSISNGTVTLLSTTWPIGHQECGGGDGGQGGINRDSGGGGGGAGGYYGNGGYGGHGVQDPTSLGSTVVGTAGTSSSGAGGGGGSAGAIYQPSYRNDRYYYPPYCGGGVGILGAGSSGVGGPKPKSDGSGGKEGTAGSSPIKVKFGAGGVRFRSGYTTAFTYVGHGAGAVRIIWGSDRQFPRTNTGNV
jgi:hypothetical protein